MIDQIAQIIVCVTGVLSITLITSGRRERRLAGAWIGVFGQLGWWTTTWINGQWWIFALAFVYAWRWGCGIINNTSRTPPEQGLNDG